jgi:hypothetical protein
MKPEKRKITIQLEDGTQEVDALVFGYWAAHRENAGSAWTVTHLGIGANIRQRAADLSRAQAIRIAQALGERAPRVHRKSRDVSRLPSRTHRAWQSIIAEALS